MMTLETDADVVAGLVLIGLAIALKVWSVATELRRRRQESRARAMRRHPSARMSEREARYHGSDAWGR